MHYYILTFLIIEAFFCSRESLWAKPYKSLHLRSMWKKCLPLCFCSVLTISRFFFLFFKHNRNVLAFLLAPCNLDQDRRYLGCFIIGRRDIHLRLLVLQTMQWNVLKKCDIWLNHWCISVFQVVSVVLVLSLHIK